MTLTSFDSVFFKWALLGSCVPSFPNASFFITLVLSFELHVFLFANKAARFFSVENVPFYISFGLKLPCRYKNVI